MVYIYFTFWWHSRLWASIGRKSVLPFFGSFQTLFATFRGQPSPLPCGERYLHQLPMKFFCSGTLFLGRLTSPFQTIEPARRGWNDFDASVIFPFFFTVFVRQQWLFCRLTFLTFAFSGLHRIRIHKFRCESSDGTDHESSKDVPNVQRPNPFSKQKHSVFGVWY